MKNKFKSLNTNYLEAPVNRYVGSIDVKTEFGNFPISLDTHNQVWQNVVMRLSLFNLDQQIVTATKKSLTSKDKRSMITILD